MTDRQPISAGDTDQATSRTMAAQRVAVTAAWLADQNRKQASYTAKRAAWQTMLERREDGAEPVSVVRCQCAKCGRVLRGGAQLRLPF